MRSTPNVWEIGTLVIKVCADDVVSMTPAQLDQVEGFFCGFAGGGKVVRSRLAATGTDPLPPGRDTVATVDTTWTSAFGQIQTLVSVRNIGRNVFETVERRVAHTRDNLKYQLSTTYLVR